MFDRSGPRPLFRFQSRNEVWALRANAAPRGDIIYRNDAGAQILRVTPDGGVTLYSTRDAERVSSLDGRGLRRGAGAPACWGRSSSQT